ncbi:MAG: TraI domain-containing protein [Succinatimonas hippei]|nr:TraI domain-containing protein [Succinatimonas hippei]
MAWFHKKAETDHAVLPQGGGESPASKEDQKYTPTKDEQIINRLEGFAVYRGEDLLALPQISGFVYQIKQALGGSPQLFEEHILPSMRVFAAYAQFLPASEPGRHHCEYLGLLIHSLQTALNALNLARNINFNTGINPDERGKNTSAAMIACCICGLLHDVGKINDFIIVTRTPRNEEFYYYFVNSLPEFLAEKWKRPISDVYIKPNDTSVANRERTARLPRYDILGMRPGRADKHELIGNEKKHLFIRSQTEQYIADASYTLYEEFHMFSYQSQLSEDYRFPNRIADLVHKADQLSAAHWNEDRHPDSPASYPDLTKFIDRYGKKGQDSEVTSEEAETIPAKEAEIPSQNSVTAKVEKTTEITGDDLKKTSAIVSDITSPQNFSEEERETGRDEIPPTVRKNLLKNLQKSVFSAELRVDQEDGCVFPFAYKSTQTPEQSNKKLVFLIDVKHPQAQALLKCVEKIEEQNGKDLFTQLKQGRNVEGAVRIFMQAGIFKPSKAYDGLYRMRPFVLYGSKHAQDGVRSVCLCEANTLIPDDSVLWDNKDLWYNRGGWFTDLSELNFDIAPKNAQATIDPFEQDRKELMQLEEKKHKEQEKKENSSAKPEKIFEKPSDLSADISSQEFFDEEFKKLKEKGAQSKTSAESKNNVDEAVELQSQKDAATPPDTSKGKGLDDPLSEFDFMQKQVLKYELQSMFKDELEEEKKNDPTVMESVVKANFKRKQQQREDKSGPVVIGEFAEDIEDRERLKKLENMQREFYCSKEVYKKLNALPEERKTELRAKHEENIRLKAGKNEDLYKGIMHELNLKRERKPSRFALVTIAKSGACYAAFLWDDTQERNNQGKRFKEELKNAGFFPLSPKEDLKKLYRVTSDDTWAELYYFECIMLNPDITAIMVLDGNEWQTKEVHRTIYHEKDKPPTTWDYVRLFQIAVLSAPIGGKLLNKFNVLGDPNYVKTVSLNAFKEFAAQTATRLNKSGDQDAEPKYPPPALTSLRSCLPLSRQKVPPYIWKPKEKLNIDDPETMEAVLKISFWLPEKLDPSREPEKPKTFSDEILCFDKDPDSTAREEAAVAMLGRKKAQQLGFDVSKVTKKEP